MPLGLYSDGGQRKKARSPYGYIACAVAENADSIINNSMHPLIRETKRECLEVIGACRGLR
jgi:hypothetical protein